MASADDISATITLELELDRMPADVLLNTVDAFVKSLAALTDQVCGDEGAIGWEIAIDKGSVLLAADPGESSDSDAVQRVRNMAAADPGALLICFHQVARAGLDGAHIWIGKERQAVACISAEEEPEPHPSQIAEYGTVEGTLDTLSARGHLRFTISEPVWNIAVRCTVPHEMAPAMQDMWRQRVSARGMVHYDRDGHPTSIQAEEVRLFPYDDTPIEEYRGLYVVD